MDLEIEDTCHFNEYSPQSCPCQHKIKLGAKKETWTGIQICQYYIDNSWPIPDHFKQHISKCEKKCDNLERKYGSYYPYSIRQHLEIHLPPGSPSVNSIIDTSDPMYIISILQ